MKAIIIKTGLEVFIREEIKPNHFWNKGMVSVSKKKDGTSIFCVDINELKII